jgi:hypothetical protein
MPAKVSKDWMSSRLFFGKNFDNLISKVKTTRFFRVVPIIHPVKCCFAAISPSAKLFNGVNSVRYCSAAFNRVIFESLILAQDER